MLGRAIRRFQALGKMCRALPSAWPKLRRSMDWGFGARERNVFDVLCLLVDFVFCRCMLSNHRWLLPSSVLLCEEGIICFGIGGAREQGLGRDLNRFTQLWWASNWDSDFAWFGRDFAAGPPSCTCGVWTSRSFMLLALSKKMRRMALLGGI